jgi:hypothetical protein
MLRYERLLNGALLVAGALLAGAVGAEGALQIDAAPCAERIHVRATDVPLGDVLVGLSKAMGFRLDAKVELAERVTFERRDTPQALLKQLLQKRNLVVQTDPNAKCRGRETLTVVWVLPAGQNAPRPAAAVPAPEAQPETSAAPGPAQPLGRHERPRGTRRSMSAGGWQKMKDDCKAGRVKADPETDRPVDAEASPNTPQ